MTRQILRGAPATLSVQILDAVGAPAAASGAVTVGVVRADGTVVVAAGTATVTSPPPPVGVHTVTVPASATAQLDVLTATWTDAGTGVARATVHEIVGGYMFSLAELRASDPTLGDTGKYPDADLVAKRAETEAEAERICAVAFVPRYARLVLSGDGTEQLVTPLHELRTVRSARILTATGASTYTALTAGQLAGLSVDDRLITRTDGGVWPAGRRNVVVEVEHGLDGPAPDMFRAALLRCRTRLNANRGQVPERAVRFTAVEGGTYELDVPDEYSTGIPDVDAVYHRYSRRKRGTNQVVPASRTLVYDPQFHSLFRGGPR